MLFTIRIYLDIPLYHFYPTPRNALFVRSFVGHIFYPHLTWLLYFSNFTNSISPKLLAVFLSTWHYQHLHWCVGHIAWAPDPTRSWLEWIHNIFVRIIFQKNIFICMFALSENFATGTPFSYSEMIFGPCRYSAPMIFGMENHSDFFCTVHFRINSLCVVFRKGGGPISFFSFG